MDEDETRDLMNKLAVAVAADSWSPVESLAPEQYTVSAISEWWSEGFLQIEGQARPGHRLRFVVSTQLSTPPSEHTARYVYMPQQW